MTVYVSMLRHAIIEFLGSGHAQHSFEHELMKLMLYKCEVSLHITINVLRVSAYTVAAEPDTSTGQCDESDAASSHSLGHKVPHSRRSLHHVSDAALCCQLHMLP